MTPQPITQDDERYVFKRTVTFMLDSKREGHVTFRVFLENNSEFYGADSSASTMLDHLEAMEK
jgi:hypothetical protein